MTLILKGYLCALIFVRGLVILCLCNTKAGYLDIWIMYKRSKSIDI